MSSNPAGSTGITTDDQINAVARRAAGKFVRGVSTARKRAQPEDRTMGFEDGMLLGTIDGIIHGTQDGTGESSDNDTLPGPIDSGR